MMSALSGYQQGTAGSHLKQYTAACGVLNFAQQYDSNQEEQLRSDLDEYLNAASAETIDILAEGCGNVDFAAREILSNGVDGVADILNDAGNPNQYDEYDPEKYEAVAGILKETLAASPRYGKRRFANLQTAVVHFIKLLNFQRKISFRKLFPSN